MNEQNKQGVIRLDRKMLKDVTELETDEIIGLLTVSLNEAIQDRLSTEVVKRMSDDRVSNSRGKTEMTEEMANQERARATAEIIDDKIAKLRILISDVRTGNFKV